MDQNNPQDPRSDTKRMIAAFAEAAKDYGLIKRNDKPDDYYGSVEHQKELSARLGIDVDNVDLEDEATLHMIINRFRRAQLEGVDDAGQPLYEGDFAVLGYFTGWRL